jgi:hypothetical protein
LQRASYFDVIDMSGNAPTTRDRLKVLHAAADNGTTSRREAAFLVLGGGLTRQPRVREG